MDEHLRQPYEGQLIKFTNVVKGWQARWFILNPEVGTLEYYLVSSHNKGRMENVASLFCLFCFSGEILIHMMLHVILKEN